MTIPAIIPTSRTLVTLTREAWGMTKADFGAKLGFTGEFAGQVEHGKRIFSDNDIAVGCSHADPMIRTFWQEYRAARRHEQDVAIIEQCFAKEIAGEKFTCGNLSYHA